MNFKILTLTQLNSKQAEEISEKIAQFNPLYFSISQSKYVFLDDTMIGIFQILYLNKTEIDLRYGLFKEFQMKKIGPYFLQNIINDIFQTDPISKIYLNIDYKNIPSIKVAEKCNLKIDYHLVETRELSGEGENFIPYYIENKMLKKENVYVFSLSSLKNNNQ